MAAEQGDVVSQVELGKIYKLDRENYKEAAKWFRMAVEQNDPEAQYYLGTLYNFGDGVEEDIDEALKWYRKSADQGYEKALEKLEWLKMCGVIDE